MLGNGEFSKTFSYFRVKSSKIELADTIFGFTKTKDVVYYEEMDHTPFYSYY